MTITEVSEPAGEPLDDIFAFCNHLAWQVGGPVLIHDLDWGVVAYSTLNQAIDDGRRLIILRRAVPDQEAEREILTRAAEGLASGAEVFGLPPVPGVQERRIIAPVRLMGVVVGSIWVAASAGPLVPNAEDVIRSAAKQASLFFQLQGDVRRRETEVFLRLLLEGRQDEGFLAQYLGVPVTTSFRVLAVWHGGVHDLVQQIESVTGAIASGHGVSVMTLSDVDRAYVIAYDEANDSDFAASTDAVAVAISNADPRLLVGAGRISGRLGQAFQSRSDADAVVAYLRRNARQRVGSHTSLRAGVTLMRLLDILDGQVDQVTGPLHGLAGLDTVDRDEAITTLNAHFTYAGNAAEAARHLHMHPNTFRYRLAKVTDILGIDLEDRETRLLLELDLMRERYTGRS